MGEEFNLLKKYPKSKRNLERGKNNKKSNQKIARKFGKEFFDGTRDTGYGGFYYNKKFWRGVIVDFIKKYKLNNKSKILDIGCGKGFMLYDFRKKLPKAELRGIDISSYAIKNSKKEIKKFLDRGCCSNLPYRDNYFDLVISINTIHNLNQKKCAKSLKEISRVSKKNSFITVDAYKNLKEKKRMLMWNLTAKTIMSVLKWKKFFKKNGYLGDYYWFIP
jgi:SAM-dependent methyltransferase